MSEIIIQAGNNGLGDSIFLTSLPELYARQGHQVIIRDLEWRNPGIRSMIWESNPYVSGFTKDAANIPGIDWGTIAKLAMKYKNGIKAIEAYYGFEPQNEYPRLYNINYQYKPELIGKSLIDFRSITAKCSKETFELFMDHLRQHDVFNAEQSYVVTSGPVNYGEDLNNSEWLANVPRYHVNDMADYISAIFSCRNFICYTSGATALASAIKCHTGYPDVYCLMNTWQYNESVWRHAGVYYFADGRHYDDFPIYGKGL